MLPKYEPWQKMITNVYRYLRGGDYEESSDPLTTVMYRE